MGLIEERLAERVLGSLSRELGTLDRVTAWLRAFVMVNAAPGFTGTPGVATGSRT